MRRFLLCRLMRRNRLMRQSGKAIEPGSLIASGVGPASRLRSDGPAGFRHRTCEGERRENSLALLGQTARADFPRPPGVRCRILKVAGWQGRHPRLRVARDGTEGQLMWATLLLARGKTLPSLLRGQAARKFLRLAGPDKSRRLPSPSRRS